jgi:Uma2 family endonuclease
MSAALQPPMTVEDFLVWERAQDLRWEFDGRRAVAVTGGSIAHSVIATNLVEALRARLGTGPCRAFRGDVKILVNGRVRYPDAVVTCAPVALGSDIVPDPVVVFEVLSPGTERTDRIAKNEEYRATPSIRRYVMLEQGEIAATVFARAGEDWVGHLFTGAAVLAMPEIGVELPLADLYAGALPAADG